MPSEDTDAKFLKAIQKNSRITIKDLSAETGLTFGACTKKLQKLVRDGKITTFTVTVDHRRFGFDVLAFTLITCKNQDRAAADELSGFLYSLDNIIEVHKVFGNNDFIIKIRARNSADLQEVIHKVSSSKHVANVQTILVSETRLEECSVPAETLLSVDTPKEIPRRRGA